MLRVKNADVGKQGTGFESQHRKTVVSVLSLTANNSLLYT